MLFYVAGTCRHIRKCQTQNNITYPATSFQCITRVYPKRQIHTGSYRLYTGSYRLYTGYIQVIYRFYRFYTGFIQVSCSHDRQDRPVPAKMHPASLCLHVRFTRIYCGFLPYVSGTNGKHSFFSGILPVFSQRNR